jgi:hypothetical protein
MNKKNQTTTMTIERFSQLLEAYGGNAKRWPKEEQLAALNLLEQSVEARRLQQSSLTLDHLLNSVQISPPSTMLRERILAQVQPLTSQAQDAWQWFIQLIVGTTPSEHFWRPAVALAIPLLLGIVIGLNLASIPTDDNGWIEEEVSLLALDSMESLL